MSVDKIRILFIGNSYTHFNNMPKMFESLYQPVNKSPQLEVEMIAIGGQTLQMHWAEGRAVESIKKGQWDYVVLQEQSSLGMTVINGKSVMSDPGLYWKYVRLFDEVIKNSNAVTVLFSTWSKLESPEDQATLDYACMAIGRELDAMIAPVGPVWKKVVKNSPKQSPYGPDGSHPSPAGSYLVALVLLASVLQEEVRGLPGHVEGHAMVEDPATFSVEGFYDMEKSVLVSLSDDDLALYQEVVFEFIRNSKLESTKTGRETSKPILYPTLEENTPPFTSLAELVGKWRGDLSFYFSPATITLEITTREKQTEVICTIEYKDQSRLLKQDISNLIQIRDRFLDFYIPHPSMVAAGEFFRGVMVNGKIEGLCEYGKKDFTPHVFGSWSVERI